MNAKKRAKTLTKQAALKRAWSIYDRTATLHKAKSPTSLASVTSIRNTVAWRKALFFILHKTAPGSFASLPTSFTGKKETVQNRGATNSREGVT